MGLGKILITSFFIILFGSVTHAQSICDNVVTAPDVGVASKSCFVKSISAKSICFGDTNPEILKGAAIIGGMMAGMSLLSPSDSCKKMSSIMKVAQATLAAYNLACYAIMTSCMASCKAVYPILAKARANVAAVCWGIPACITPEENAITACYSDVGTASMSCEASKLNLAAGAAGLLALVMQAKKSSKCQDDTTLVDCTKPENYLNPKCSATTTTTIPIDCSISNNASNIRCICQANPNLPGCAGADDPSSNDNSYNPQANKLTNEDTPLPTDINLGGGDGGLGGGFGGGSPSGGGSGIGGGAGGGGGPSGSAGNKAGADGKTGTGGSSLNPNILSGYEGGGGGGGRGGSGGGYADPKEEKYKKYMPNADKEKRGPDSMKLFGNGEVTGSGGMSNFEKVNRCYQENKATFNTAD